VRIDVELNKELPGGKTYLDEANLLGCLTTIVQTI